MCKFQMLRALVKQRLTAATEEIFGLFERTIAEYEEELSRSKEEIERQRKLLDAVFNSEVQIHRAVSTDDQQLLVVKEEVPPEQQDWSSSLDQEDPEPPHIKEEQEELWTSQEGEQLQGLEEADITKFPFSPVPVKSEEEEEPQSSQLHQRQTEHIETEADGEDCGGPEPARNSDPDTHPEPDTVDSWDWENTKEPQLGLNSLQVNNTFDSTSTTAVRRFNFPPGTPQHGPPRNRPLSGSTGTDEKKLLSAVMGLSRQMTQFAAEVKPQLTAVSSRLLSVEERMAALEAKANFGPGVEDLKRKRRAHNPKIAETVRRLHNSKANCRRYNPEQGITSPHNQAVTSYLVEALAASPDLHNVDNDTILSACKTYCESLRRTFRFSQPDLAAHAAALRTSARSRQRRKRLLEARQSVLSAEDVGFWSGVTIDMMSDEEDGDFGEVSGWIVRPPSFRSQELTGMCAKLQARLEANPKYTAKHHRRLHVGPDSDRTPPNAYDSEAAERHFKAHLVPKVQLLTPHTSASCHQMSGEHVHCASKKDDREGDCSQEGDSVLSLVTQSRKSDK